MSCGIGATVEVITTTYLGRWIYPLERGIIVSQHISPVGQGVYDVYLEGGKKYTFAPSEIEELQSA